MCQNKQLLLVSPQPLEIVKELMTPPADGCVTERNRFNGFPSANLNLKVGENEKLSVTMKLGSAGTGRSRELTARSPQ
jgi:hypothetical protein